MSDTGRPAQAQALVNAYKTGNAERAGILLDSLRLKGYNYQRCFQLDSRGRNRALKKRPEQPTGAMYRGHRIRHLICGMNHSLDASPGFEFDLDKWEVSL